MDDHGHRRRLRRAFRVANGANGPAVLQCGVAGSPSVRRIHAAVADLEGKATRIPRAEY